MNYVNTMIAAIALMTSVFQTGCIEEDLTRPLAEEAGGSEAPDAPGAGSAGLPGENAPEGEGLENSPGHGSTDGASPGDPAEGGEEDDTPGTPQCLGLDGEVAHECDEGFRCVEFCANDCDGDICPQICRIAYRCEADERPAPGDVENPIGEGGESNEGGQSDEDEEGGVVVSPIADGDDESDDEGESGVSSGEPGAGDDEDDRPEFPRGGYPAVCTSPDGDIALECEEGFECVERCVSPCEDDEEVCPQICRIEYTCQAI